MKKKKHLGKGLANLLDIDSQNHDDEIFSELEGSSSKERQKSKIVYLEIGSIYYNKDNPRKHFDQSYLDQLAQTIEEHGLFHPILVRKKTESDSISYEVISGERRLRALKIIGKTLAPCIIKEVNDQENLEIALIENIQREQLDIIEEANVYKRLIENYNFTHEQISARVGKNRSTISNRLRTLSLPEEIQADLSSGKITEGQVRPLINITDVKIQNEIYTQIQKHNYNSRDIEALVKKYKSTSERKLQLSKKQLSSPQKDLNIEVLEQELEQEFSTRVSIQYNPKKKSGKIEINFFNLEDFDVLLTKLIKK